MANVHIPKYVQCPMSSIYLGMVNTTQRLDANKPLSLRLVVHAPSSLSNPLVAIANGESIDFLRQASSSHANTPARISFGRRPTPPRHGVAELGVDMIAHAMEREIPRRGAYRIEASVHQDNKAIRVRDEGDLGPKRFYTEGSRGASLHPEVCLPPKVIP